MCSAFSCFLLFLHEGILGLFVHWLFFFNQNAACFGLSCMCLSLWILYGDFRKPQNFRDKSLLSCFYTALVVILMAVVNGTTIVSLSLGGASSSQEIVPFNTERRLREECVLSLAFVSEHLYAFFVSKITSSSWLRWIHLQKQLLCAGLCLYFSKTFVRLRSVMLFLVLSVIMLALWSRFVFWMPHGPSQINTVGTGLVNEVWNLRDLELE